MSHPPLATLENAPLKDLQPVRFSALAQASLSYGRFAFDPTVRTVFRPNGKVNSESVYVFNSLTIKGNVPEDVLLASIDVVNWPYATIWSSMSGLATSVTMPFPVAAYTDGAPFMLAWQSAGNPDVLALGMVGFVNQTIGILNAGISTVNITLILGGFAISNNAWKDQFLKGWGEDSWIAQSLLEQQSANSVRLMDGSSVLRQRGY